MNKKITIGIIVLALFVIVMVMAKNDRQQVNTRNGGKTVNTIQTQNIENSADKLEIYYFHRTQRCYSCSTIGQYVKETIKQKFSEEIKNSEIDFREINVDLSENKDVAKKFQASGSSLFINAIKNGQDNINQDTNVWRLLRNESQFKNYLEDKINSLLDK